MTQECLHCFDPFSCYVRGNHHEHRCTKHNRVGFGYWFNVRNPSHISYLDYYTSPHTTLYVSSYYCTCPHNTICPNTTIHVSSILLCVRILLYTCPHTNVVGRMCTDHRLPKTSPSSRPASFFLYDRLLSSVGILKLRDHLVRIRYNFPHPYALAKTVVHTNTINTS